MTKRYTNISRIKRSNVLDEFKGYVSGMVNQDNSLTFDKAFNAVKDLVTGNTSTLSSTLSSLSDKEIRDISEIFLGVDGGAYFIKDLYSGEAIKSYNSVGINTAFKDLSSSISIIYETKLEVKNGIINSAKTGLENLRGAKSKDISSIIAYGNVNNEFKFKENDKEYGKIASSLDVPDETLTNSVIAGELDINKEISDPNRITQPSLGAIVFKDGQFSLSKRGQDEIAVFFNMLSNLEMSKCSPYLYVSVVTKGKEKKISLDKYFGFNDSDFTNIISNFTSEKAKDYLSKINQKINPLETYQSAGMEIFTSPQTLSNADIRKIPGKETVLEPISSLLSIQSVNIENAGLGYGLFSSKRARIELVLHDRSRLRDIAPLISVEEFGQTKIVMEYGWHHPEGGSNSDNPIGIFLNSLREGGVFVVVKSDFGFNEKSVKITLDLAMSGENEVRRVSAATGLKIQSSIAKPQIENAISEIIKNKDLKNLKSIKKLENIESPEARKQEELKEVRRVSRLAVGEYTNKNSLINRSDFSDIIRYSGNSGNDKNEEQLISVIESAYDLSSGKLDKISSVKEINKSESKLSEDGLNLIRQLSMKLRAFEQSPDDDPFLVDTENSLDRLSSAGVSNASRESTEQSKISSNILSDAISHMKTRQSDQTALTGSSRGFIDSRYSRLGPSLA